MPKQYTINVKKNVQNNKSSLGGSIKFLVDIKGNRLAPCGWHHVNPRHVVWTHTQRITAPPRTTVLCFTWQIVQRLSHPVRRGHKILGIPAQSNIKVPKWVPQTATRSISILKNIKRRGSNHLHARHVSHSRNAIVHPVWRSPFPSFSIFRLVWIRYRVEYRQRYRQASERGFSERKWVLERETVDSRYCWLGLRFRFGSVCCWISLVLPIDFIQFFGSINCRLVHGFFVCGMWIFNRIALQISHSIYWIEQ